MSHSQANVAPLITKETIETVTLKNLVSLDIVEKNETFLKVLHLFDDSKIKLNHTPTQYENIELLNQLIEKKTLELQVANNELSELKNSLGYERNNLPVNKDTELIKKLGSEFLQDDIPTDNTLELIETFKKENKVDVLFDFSNQHHRYIDGNYLKPKPAPMPTQPRFAVPFTHSESNGFSNQIVQSQAHAQPQVPVQVQLQVPAQIQVQLPTQAETQPQVQVQLPAQVHPQVQTPVPAQILAQVPAQVQVQAQPQAQPQVQPQVQNSTSSSSHDSLEDKLDLDVPVQINHLNTGNSMPSMPDNIDNHNNNLNSLDNLNNLDNSNNTDNSNNNNP